MEKRLTAPIVLPPEMSADEIRKKVDNLLEEIQSDQQKLGRRFVQLGNALLTIRNRGYWREWEGTFEDADDPTKTITRKFDTFNEYIGSLKERVDLGRTQLYQTIAVSEQLLPKVGEEQLIQMGISKAIELKRVVKSGKAVTESLLRKATDKDVKVHEVREAAFRTMNAEPDHVGQYFDIGGFFATKDERAEIKQAFDLARKTDPVTSKEIPDWAQLKDIMLKLCREYVSSYAAPVARGEG